MAEAVKRLGQAVRDGWGAGYNASVVRGLSKSTLDRYLGALAKLRRRVLEDELGDIAAQNVGEGNIKKLLLGVRLLEKLGWIKSTVQPGDWYLVLGVEKERERQGRGALKEWASMEALRYMAGVVHTKAEWEILALAALSCAHCLRASEAIKARAEGSELVVRGTKSLSGRRSDSGRRSGPHSWRGSGRAMDTNPTSLRGSRGRTGYTGDCTAFWNGPVDPSSICAGTRSGGSGQPSSTASGSRCGSSCSGGGVEVGDSGGYILQGAAAMEVRARGTHSPA